MTVTTANPRALFARLTHELPPELREREGRDVHRSSKDLGRILALTWLESRDEVDTWSERWEDALRTCFPTRWRELAARVGDGLRALLEDTDRFDEAWHCCNVGCSRDMASPTLSFARRQISSWET